MIRSLVPAAVLLAVLMAASSGCGDNGGGNNGQEGKDEPGASAEGSERNLSSVVLELPEGGTKKISDYSGRILMVQFFTTWHKDTGKLVEWMNKIDSKFRSNVDVIGLAMDRGGRPAVRTFLAENDVRFDVYSNGAEVANQFGGVRTLPTTYILTREGTVLRRFDGLQRYDVYEKIILGMYRRRM